VYPGLECRLDKRQTILDGDVTELIKGTGEKRANFKESR
jgi:hypothetical protein